LTPNPKIGRLARSIGQPWKGNPVINSKEAQSRDNVRRRVNRAAQSGNNVVSLHDDSEIFNRIESRFRILDKLSDSVISGKSNALILSGPPGVGKSHLLEKKVAKYDPNAINVNVSKGYIRTTALYRILWECREKGQLAVFDDADSVFGDLNSLNLLKSALDTGKNRVLTYGSDYVITDSQGRKVPNKFEFSGSAIFITNYDFDALIEKKHKFSEHFKALMSRSHYVTLGMRTPRDYLVRIHQVVETPEFAEEHEVDSQTIEEILEYIDHNYDRMRELSIRSAKKLIDLRETDPDGWQELADLTCLI